MFHAEFFPTPVEVAKKMIAPYMDRIEHSEIRFILEPSAGKGDILDVLQEERRHPVYSGLCGNATVFAIESDPSLQAILRSKGYSVIDSDFLQHVAEYRFDLILMNPPFSNGDEHLLHAWQVLHGGDIACLLNAETIRNPYSAKRKLLADLIAAHGSVEELGAVFQDAERETDVDVVLVRLTKPVPEDKDFGFEFTSAGDFESVADVGLGSSLDGQNTSQGLMRPDAMGAAIRQYEKVVEAFADVKRAQAKLEFFAKGYVDTYDLKKMLDNLGGMRMTGADTLQVDSAAMAQDMVAFREQVRAKFWRKILQDFGMQKLLTADLLKKFDQFVQEQGHMALTKNNIEAVLSMITFNAGSILDQCVEQVFDSFTKYHEYNRCHIEGWKTNSAWKVNRKVIIPFAVSYSYGSFSHNWSSYGLQLDDIDRAMSYLTGKRFDDVTTIRDSLTTQWQADRRNPGVCESEFFKIRFFKKGTIHIEFLDESLWRRFNMTACRGRNWLGGEFA